MKFEDYFRKQSGLIDHTVRVMSEQDGTLWFYIHPSNANGVTKSYRIEGNELIPIYEQSSEAPVQRPASR